MREHPLRGVARCRASVESERNYPRTTQTSEQLLHLAAAGFVVADGYSVTGVCVSAYSEATGGAITDSQAADGSPADGKSRKCHKAERETADGDAARRESSHSDDADSAPADGNHAARATTDGDNGDGRRANSKERKPSPPSSGLIGARVTHVVRAHGTVLHYGQNHEDENHE